MSTLTMERQMAAVGRHSVDRHAVEDFLYEEAALLDAWRLDEWLELLSDDVTYEIPALGASEHDLEALFVIRDDAYSLRARVAQLLDGSTRAEHPFSRTRRSITNVRIRETSGHDIVVSANFVIHRFRQDTMDTYVGAYQHVLQPCDGGFKIRRRRTFLDLETFRPPVATFLTIIL